jgi:hypothetical protein
MHVTVRTQEVLIQNKLKLKLKLYNQLCGTDTDAGQDLLLKNADANPVQFVAIL